MERTIRGAIFAMLALMAIYCRVSAGEAGKLEQLIRQRAEAITETQAVLGLAIGVVDGEKTYCVCAGSSSLGGVVPDERTIFEIGSITKSFTGILLGDAVVRGEVKLDQPVAQLLKPAAVVPSFEGREIRLADLATQTSGLPRLPSNFGLLVNPLNPYANYDANDLYKFLAKHKLRRSPGKEYEYSNLGMGLLGFALANRANTSYEELVKERICQPLGMDDTVISLSKRQKSRLASGISNLALPTMNWDIPALAGCGGIRSTLRDMLLYLQANLDPGKFPLEKAMLLSQTPQFTIRPATKDVDESLEIGLGWHITVHEGTKIVWHNGMTGGYASFMAFVPSKRWGIVVLGNTASSEIDQLGNTLLQERLAEKLPSGV